MDDYQVCNKNNSFFLNRKLLTIRKKTFSGKKENSFKTEKTWQWKQQDVGPQAKWWIHFVVSFSLDSLEKFRWSFRDMDQWFSRVIIIMNFLYYYICFSIFTTTIHPPKKIRRLTNFSSSLSPFQPTLI